MKPITNEEAKLIRRNVLLLKEIAKQNESIHAKLGTNSKMMQWIQSDEMEFTELEHSEQQQVLRILFDQEINNRSTRKNNELYLIIKFLQAATDRRYDEVAWRLQEFNGSFQYEYLDHNIEIARVIMCHGTDVKQRYQEYDKNLTVEKEVKQIKRKHKVMQKEETKRINEYRNIWRIYSSSDRYFEDICHFIEHKNPSLKNKIEKGSSYYHPNEIQQFVDENFKEVHKFLFTLFPFASNLNYDKIK